MSLSEGHEAGQGRRAGQGRATLLGVLHGEQRVLEGGVLVCLLQVAVHLSRRGEDALRARGGGGLGEVLLGHLGQLGPAGLVVLPPLEQLDLRAGEGRGEVLVVGAHDGVALE